ncbi:hypothetical protein [Viridibacterium curvum]|uniref:hypothetical protein n=1 Tax=Viridibacterium curvum TaxID=1101404 RepID=UPI0031E6984D
MISLFFAALARNSSLVQDAVSILAIPVSPHFYPQVLWKTQIAEMRQALGSSTSFSLSESRARLMKEKVFVVRCMVRTRGVAQGQPFCCRAPMPEMLMSRDNLALLSCPAVGHF